MADENNNNNEKSIAERLEEMENQVAEMKAILGAGENLAETGKEPFGIDRLRQVERKTGLPDEIKEASK